MNNPKTRTRSKCRLFQLTTFERVLIIIISLATLFELELEYSFGIESYRMITTSQGPRALLKDKERQTIAEEKMLLQREEVARKQQDSPDNIPLQSTAQHSQRQSKDWLSEENLEDIVMRKDQLSKETVTYWSHPLLNESLLNGGAPLFGKDTVFSNDINDSRVRHTE